MIWRISATASRTDDKKVVPASDQNPCTNFELKNSIIVENFVKIFQNESKKLSLRDATVKPKNWTLHMHRESHQLKRFLIEQELDAVQLKMCPTPPP